ncbi:endonuclease/exonuclease/phosphatase family protein [Massilia sp. AB1]|uniref:endonuclease/exonuclease/phosphatase family protein n=1 Tax=Massilia sp. AB1 TaxID=2823371 RepID=UPI001B823C45|nr:endonuclease/exonuclease/phosphatase family protein [Massilia sp. AB1]MBQ5939832.1 endonuclease/exonuclease/phosphatase family protein [Massilia sp. AB1]
MFKLITWNIQSGRNPEGNIDLDRIVACLERFARHDVICLQEVSSGYGDGEDQFAALRARLPGHAAAAAYACDTAGPGAPDAPRLRTGCMILSRHPILESFRHTLPWPPDPGVPSMPRTALEVTVAAPGGLLRVVSAHLEYFSCTQRLAQVERLRELQREAWLHARVGRASGDGPFAAVPRAGPALLAGDFNMLPGSLEHQRLLAPFDDDTPPWRDCWHLAQPGRRHAPTVGLHDLRPDAAPPFTFDYVFASADLAGKVRRMRIDASEQGSDHQAVLVELDWNAA